MKKKFFVAACVLLISGLAACFMNSCDKDTNCYLQVTVKDSKGGLVPHAWVKVDIDSSYVSRQGYTNAQGRFDTVFEAPAIFNINAKFEHDTFYTEIYTRDNYYCYQKGNNTVRLKEGETVEATVTLDPGIVRERR